MHQKCASCVLALRSVWTLWSPTEFDITGWTTPLRALKYPWIPSTLNWVRAFNALLWSNPNGLNIPSIRFDHSVTKGNKTLLDRLYHFWHQFSHMVCIYNKLQVKISPVHWTSEHTSGIPMWYGKSKDNFPARWACEFIIFCWLCLELSVSLDETC